jgi:hypothetical protein
MPVVAAWVLAEEKWAISANRAERIDGHLRTSLVLYNIPPFFCCKVFATMINGIVKISEPGGSGTTTSAMPRFAEAGKFNITVSVQS